MRIRPVERDDHDRWAALFRGYRSFYELEPSEAVVATVWSWLIDAANPVTGLLAEADGRAVALGHWSVHLEPWQAESVVHLHDLFVDPAARGAGAATAILTHLAGLAAERGCMGVEWVTAASNATARRVYDRVAQRTDWVTYEMPAARGV